MCWIYIFMLSLWCLWSCMISVASSYLARVDATNSKREYLCSIVGFMPLFNSCRCHVATREKTTFLCLRTFALFTICTLFNAIICCLQLNTQGVLGWFPSSEFLVIDAVGLRSMYFVVMPRVNLIVILMTYVHYLCSINCPTIISLPRMCYLSYGETPLVNCGPRSNFLYITIPF
jgi:hypothetical protein